ncbi:MAG: hypothetical protein LBE36_08985 [Flavobacteriaceae bacterium]|jgi:hypothetical protein|nr:hypothetical protein [Flavobacteriaceae bacterium]
MTKNFVKTFFIIVGIEVILFITMIFFTMTDESVGVAGKSLEIIVKYILSFPLVLLNREYPFFINSSNPPNYMILLIVLNLLVQTVIVIFLGNTLKMLVSFIRQQ